MESTPPACLYGDGASAWRHVTPGEPHPYELLARYRRDGDAVFEPRSRRPHTSPSAIPAEVVELILELREKLKTTGLDAGPDTIRWHLAHHHGVTVSRATIARYLTQGRAGGPGAEETPQVLLHPVPGLDA